jgi:hypothetical protein
MGFSGKILAILILSSLLVGFRFFPGGNNWDLDRTSPATSKLFVVYDNPTRTLENDLPEGDPLHGTPTITVAQAMTSILNDYNNVGASFLILTDQNDSDFAARSEGRTITIVEANTDNPVSGADASPAKNPSTGRIVSCRVRVSPKLFEKASLFVWATAHEMGHCLGLDHPQDITRSIMSYFQPERYARLQADDKMGITYLYPQNPENAREIATLGLSCARQ